MDPGCFPCQLVSWDEAYRLSKRLAQKIKSTKFRPDLVVAIGRGGYVPARIVCDFLLHNLLTSIKVEHWDIAACKRAEAKVRFPLAIDVQDQKILIIDDVTDTGDTLKAAVEYVEGLGSGQIKTGVLQHKIRSSFVPDYYAELVEKWRWIIYPWAAHEDLVGFTSKILLEDMQTREDIQVTLERQYGLIVDEESLLEVLDDLIDMGQVEKKGEKFRKI